MRVGQHFAAGSSVERAAFGVLDARVSVERGFFGATGIVNALGARERVDVLVIEIEIAGERSEFVGFRYAGVRVFGSDFRQFERRLQHSFDASRRKIARVRGRRAFSEEDAHADGSRSCFFQRFDLSEADDGGEFIALADDALGGRGAALHGATDHISSMGLKVGGNLRIAFQSCCHYEVRSKK